MLKYYCANVVVLAATLILGVQLGKWTGRTDIVCNADGSGHSSLVYMNLSGAGADKINNALDGHDRAVSIVGTICNAVAQYGR